MLLQLLLMLISMLIFKVVDFNDFSTIKYQSIASLSFHFKHQIIQIIEISIIKELFVH